MTGKCPYHGRQPYCLVSPDLVSTEAEIIKSINDSHEQPLLIYLTTELTPNLVSDCFVTVSKSYYNLFGISSLDLDYKEVFINSAWFRRLASMCFACYTERWPALVQEAEQRRRESGILRRRIS
jgi:hypothetical protein